jgi:uncharacterized membrane protein
MTGRGGGRRLAAAMLVSVAVGAAIYWIVIVRGLPALAHRLSDEQILALRDGLRTHPFRVLGTVVLAAAALALPVLVVFRLVYGPLTGSREPRE